MAIFYQEIDRKKWFYEPASSRSRQRYRGARESYKVNLEISSFLFDINNINKKMNNLVQTSLRHAAYIARGVELDPVSYADTFTALIGFLDMSSQVEDLKTRIIEMERKHV